LNEALAVILFVVFCVFTVSNWMNRSRLDKLRKK